MTITRAVALSLLSLTIFYSCTAGVIWLLETTFDNGGAIRQPSIHMATIHLPSTGNAVDAVLETRVYASKGTLLFPEDLSVDQSLLLVGDTSVHPGQRNECFNFLREVDPSLAAELLIKHASDVRETALFRSWCYQHMGMIWDDVDDTERNVLIECIESGLRYPVDTPIWKEAIFALSYCGSPRAVFLSNKELESLTETQIRDLGPIYREIQARIGD